MDGRDRGMCRASNNEHVRFESMPNLTDVSPELKAYSHCIHPQCKAPISYGVSKSS
jgi:hypothetical protein